MNKTMLELINACDETFSSSDPAVNAAALGAQNVNSAMSTIDALRQQLADVSSERDGLRAAQDWIKCSDRLPECPHECTSDETMVSNTLWVTDSSDPGSMGMAHMRKDGSWKSYGGDYDFMVPDTITHWMPLPNPPTEQEAQQ